MRFQGKVRHNPSRTTASLLPRIPQHPRREFGVLIFRHLFELAGLKAEHEAIGVAVGLSRLGHVVAARLDGDEVAIGRIPLGRSGRDAKVPHPRVFGL